MDIQTGYVVDDSPPPGAGAQYGYPSEMEIFTLPPNDLSREKTVLLVVSPMAPITPGCNFDFNLMPNTTMYIDTKNIVVYVRGKIVRSDGTPATESEVVTLINYPGATIFQRADAYLQQQIVSSSSTTYPYKAMFDALLESDWGDIRGQMLEGLFVRENTGNMDSASIRQNINGGFQTRFNYTKGSKLVELQTKLHIDVLKQERLFINGLQLTIKLTQCSEPFRLMRAPPEESEQEVTYRFDIHTCVLKIPMAKPTAAMMFGHEAGLLKSPALYPFERTEIKTAAIPRGMSQWPLDNLFLTAQPKRLLIAIVSSAAYNGAYDKNPFNFQHFKLNYLCLTIDGSCVPSQAFQPDYEEGIYLECYDSLFSIAPEQRVGKTRKATTINRDEYVDGHCMYMFNLDGGSQGSPFVNPQRIGLNKLELRFAERLPEPVTVIMYATYNAILKIDQMRNVKIEG